MSLIDDPIEIPTCSGPRGELRYDPLLTPAEVATFFRVTAAQVREWLREGTIPRAPLPGQSRVYRSVLLSLVGSSDPDEWAQFRD